MIAETIENRINALCIALGIAIGVLSELSVDDGIPFDRAEGIKLSLEKICKVTDEIIYK